MREIQTQRRTPQVPNRGLTAKPFHPPLFATVSQSLHIRHANTLDSRYIHRFLRADLFHRVHDQGKHPPGAVPTIGRLQGGRRIGFGFTAAITGASELRGLQPCPPVHRKGSLAPSSRASSAIFASLSLCRRKRRCV